MDIILTRNTVIERDRSGSVGQRVTVSAQIGRTLILMGKAVEAPPVEVKPEPNDPESDPAGAPPPAAEGEERPAEEDALQGLMTPAAPPPPARRKK